MANDDELAATLPDEMPAAIERVSQWTPEREALASIYDRMGSILGAQIAMGGGKVPMIDPFPRPETAQDRARAKAASEQHQSLVERLVGR